MNRDIYSQAEQLSKKHRRKRTWYKIPPILSGRRNTIVS